MILSAHPVMFAPVCPDIWEMGILVFLKNYIRAVSGSNTAIFWPMIKQADVLLFFLQNGKLSESIHPLKKIAIIIMPGESDICWYSCDQEDRNQTCAFPRSYFNSYAQLGNAAWW